MRRKIVRNLLPLLLAAIFCLNLAPCAAAAGNLAQNALTLFAFQFSTPEPATFDVPPYEPPDMGGLEITDEPSAFSVPEMELQSLRPEDLKLAEHLMGATFVDMGEAIQSDTVKVSFSKAFFCDQVRPTERDMVYVGYNASEGEKYLVVKGEITNLGTEDLKVDMGPWIFNYLALVLYNGTLYQCGIALENEAKDTLTSSLPAGQTLSCYAMFSVAEENVETDLHAWLFFGCSDFSECVFDSGLGIGPSIEWDRCDFLAC